MPVGEVFLGAFLQVLFDRLAPQKLLLFPCEAGIRSELEQWKKKLLRVQAVLDDAEEKQMKNEAVKMWLDDLRDLAYDVDDILDGYATQVLETELRSKQPVNSTFADYLSVLSDLSPSSLISKVNVESKIEDITNRLEDLCEQRNDLGLKDMAGASSCISWRRPESTCVPIEPAVYGRDEDISKMLEMVLTDEINDVKFRVIPIVGMAGVGKTTLARQVYNDDRVKDFNPRIWVCFSYDWDILRISKAILESITFFSCDLKDLNPVQVKLREVVAGKKFLLVLDDVWKMNYGSWEVLKSPFMAAAPGSKIIVTTRSMEVASTVAGPKKSYELKLLSDDDCWPVFVKHAFESRDVGAIQNLDILRQKVVDKCKGLPLVASNLGGLLHSKHEYEEWEDILNGKIWNLSADDCDILPILKQSYHHLPSHLKRCFSYCALFPKGYEFEEKELVLLWMAEGLIQPSKNKSLEDIGSEYFHDLLSRSIFQKSSSGHVSLHDLVNDLAQWVSGETTCRLDELEVDNMKSRRLERIRHCSYTCGNFDGKSKFGAFQGVNELRTFLPLPPPLLSFPCFITSMVLFDLLPKCKKLRVLSLAGYRISELPNSIGGLRHLRYLDFSNTNIRSLPESTSSLFNLQVLLLRNCFQLKKLPSNMGKLINLRHLDISGANLIRKMPLGMKELKCLRTLSNFIVGRISGSDLQDLKNLKFLCGKLCISRLHNVIPLSQDSRETILIDKNLKVLSLKWQSEFDDSRKEEAEENVLDILRPHKNLKDLTIRCYGGTKFSSWIADPSLSNMVILNLESCMNCIALPSLGILSSLKNLTIRRMQRIKSIGYEFYGESCTKPFQLLETLHFEDLQDWENWEPVRENEHFENFPRLQELVISSCPKLSGKLPDHLPSLEKLVIYFCEQLVVSGSSYPTLGSLDINGCKGLTWRDPNHFNSLKSMRLLNVSMLRNWSRQDFQKFECLEIGNCEELMYLWQKNEICLEKQSQVLHSFNFLRKLSIEKCNALTSLPKGMYDTACLESLRIEDCHSLTFILKSQLPLSLRLLEIKNCDNLRLLLDDKYETSPSSSSIVIQQEFVVNNNGSLKFLHIDHCPSLTCLSSTSQLPATLAQLDIRHCSQLTTLSSRTQLPAKLTHLKIEDCPELVTLSSRGQLPATLTHLEIDDCSNLESIVSIGQLPQALEVLQIKRCPELKSIAEKFYNNKSLKDILISKCENLKSIPESLRTLSNLTDFCIFYCPSLVSFPQEGLPNSSLNNVLIHRCEKLNFLPNCLHSLKSLRKLSISECPSIVSFPAEGFPSSLTSLSIKDLNIYKPLREWGLHKLKSLLELKICGSDEVTFPGMGTILPTSIIRLSIKSFQHLKYLSSKGFHNLSSLESLTISGCPNLTFFPGLPSSLLQLYIKNCPLLETQCQRDKGQDWAKIAHIPCVKIDDKFVYDPQEEDLYSISGSL